MDKHGRKIFGRICWLELGFHCNEKRTHGVRFYILLTQRFTAPSFPRRREPSAFKIKCLHSKHFVEDIFLYLDSLLRRNGGDAISADSDYLQQLLPSICIGGQATVPYEQNTQQSPALGLSKVLHCSHS